MGKRAVKEVELNKTQNMGAERMLPEAEGYKRGHENQGAGKRKINNNKLCLKML